MTYLNFLESLVEDAGKLAMTFPQNMPSRIKGADRNQVVTSADLAIGSQIRRRIRERFPDDSVIDEESGAVRGASPITWIIDPIDGTSNFAAGSPLFGVMVGVLKHDKPVAGGVALPAFSETYVAEAGEGAYCNETRLRIKARGDLAQQLIAYGMDIHPSEISLDCRMLAGIASCCRGIRMSNSIFDCMMVAKGAYGGFMHRRNQIWDCVAAQIIIEEAGGMFTDMNGRPLDYSYPLTKTADVFSILACGPDFHRTITDITRDQPPQ
ncbi:inositol monophosphatase family protein [Streptomyces iranensis]|uniref:Myo-inositol-1(Or 4)-monophosphatase n=1 Tax=Streptomyces iranensis TaxID=576784 RepID=A0ABS4N503_9ACTN|nr:inositol monophosphatase [Streptomyces iranensis]MBP2067074.1 myo-inositol-1(or 4)-monophosphatase [Streptomyces iranensis]